MNPSKTYSAQKNSLAKNAKVFIFVALECEAKPLVRYFDLSKEKVKWPFSIYKNDEIVLTVTGVGKVAMAGAVTYTLALFPTSQFPVLLNMGIAGHKTQAIGELLLATKIIDEDSGKRYYPPGVASNLPKTSTLMTVSRPCKYYSQDVIYDMEASAFYEMAVKFSTRELIHSIKVVSDNEQSSIENINPKRVIQWLTNQVDEIEAALNSLLKLREIIVPKEPIEYADIVKKWHFTVSGKIKLKALLLRWSLLSTDIWFDADKKGLTSAKKVLQKLEHDINQLEVHL